MVFFHLLTSLKSLTTSAVSSYFGTIMVSEAHSILLANLVLKSHISLEFLFSDIQVLFGLLREAGHGLTLLLPIMENLDL